MSNVSLIWVTPEAEKLVAYCARVSNPENQDNPEIEKLLAYCAKNKHWSIFEMANMCVEISTSRAISAQILRHKSFSFQEHSQRYAKVQSFEKVHPRRQDSKNRQNSIDDLTEETIDLFNRSMETIQTMANTFYETALKNGIAKESARFLLPMCSSTKLYMNGTVRSWIHYIQVRTDPSTQLEHREIAEQIKQIFIEQFPIISKAIGWTDGTQEKASNE